MKKKNLFIIITLFIIFLYTVNISQLPTSVFLLNGEGIKFQRLYGIEITESKSETKETWQDQGIQTKKMNVTLFGTVKVKEIAITTYPRLKVIPAGNLIGLKLYTNGVLVIGTTEVKNMDGQVVKPFETTNIQEGDTITEIDNKEIDSTQSLLSAINNSEGRQIEIKYLRDGEEKISNITPVETNKGEYKLGLWVRDSASGVGTMTFYEPESKRFAALGHGISDGDTGELLDIEKGEVVNSKVVNITKGNKGFPGEIKGSILKEATIGGVNKNTDFGIFGILEDKKDTIDRYKDGVEVALREEIQLGEATILATLETDKTEEYKIEIVRDRFNE